MRSKLLFALADTLGIQLDFVEPDLLMGGRNKALTIFDHKHTHRVVIIGSAVIPNKFAAVGVRVIGDLGLVIIAENFDNVPVTTMAVDMRKVDLQAIFKGGKLETVTAIKEAVKPGVRATMTRDMNPVANNEVRKWACSA